MAKRRISDVDSRELVYQGGTAYQFVSGASDRGSGSSHGGCSLPSVCGSRFGDRSQTDGLSSTGARCTLIHEARDTTDRIVGDATKVEKDLARELNNLSVNERNKVWEDIHGVSEALDMTIESDPRLLNSCFERLSLSIKKIRPKQRRHYERAVFLSPHRYSHQYFNPSSSATTTTTTTASGQPLTPGQRFALNYLRSVEYDTTKAAAKIVKYFDIQAGLFGEDTVGRPVSLLRDFTEGEREHIKAGGCQPLPIKDRSGRLVYFVTPMLYDWAKEEIMFRKMFYTMSMLAETDESFCTKGMVSVFYFVGPGRVYPTSFIKQIARGGGINILRAMPFYEAAKHACYDRTELKPLLYVIPKVAHAMGRVRFLTHFGSHMECLYKLKSFGIPVEDFPLCAGESLQLRNLNWQRILNDREAKERDDESRWLELVSKNSGHDASQIVEMPTQKDVLLGRGRPYQEFAGNIYLSTLVDEYMTQHQSSGSYGAKNAIADEIMGIIRENGGRFLKRRDRPEDGWVEVTKAVAREKVKYGFRTKNKRQRQLLGKVKSLRSDKSIHKILMHASSGRSVVAPAQSGSPFGFMSFAAQQTRSPVDAVYLTTLPQNVQQTTLGSETLHPDTFVLDEDNAPVLISEEPNGSPLIPFRATADDE